MSPEETLDLAAGSPPPAELLANNRTLIVCDRCGNLTLADAPCHWCGRPSLLERVVAKGLARRLEDGARPPPFGPGAALPDRDPTAPLLDEGRDDGERWTTVEAEAQVAVTVSELRDLFACAALKSLVFRTPPGDERETALRCWALADALLVTREVGR